MKTKIVTFGEILLRISKPGYQRLFQGHRMFGNYGGSEANAAISLAHLGDNVEYSEARLFAYEALSYPQTLAERYGLVYPPTLHNLLINTGLKERGLCYQWSEGNSMILD